MPNYKLQNVGTGEITIHAFPQPLKYFQPGDSIQLERNGELQEFKILEPDQKPPDGPVDFFDKPLYVGDYIIFSCRKSSSHWLQFAKILEITEASGWNGEKEYRLKVQSMRKRADRIKLLKPGIVTRLDRCVKFNPLHVPQKYVDLFIEAESSSQVKTLGS